MSRNSSWPTPSRWLESLFVAILRHEYASAMSFASGGDGHKLPRAPADPCQLYIHVPFCQVLCPFCSFHRVRFRDGHARRYFGALRAEIARYHEQGFRFADVYVGGGTPTVAPDELGETLDLVRRLWPVRSISVETNPSDLRPEIFAVLDRARVTRLSVGVQSFDDGLLRAMGRFDTYGSGAVIRERLAAAQGRFRTLNVDMIFNLPGQTAEMLERDIAVLLELGVDQISFYPLMTAPTARRKVEAAMGRSDPALRLALYRKILRAMRPAYRASSAWCFSRGEGMVDEYIIDQDDYVGVGSGAFSYVDGTLYSTTFSLRQYCDRVLRGRTGITQSKVLTPHERMRNDYLVRLFGGELRREEIRRKHGASFWLRMAPELLAMRLVGATRHDSDAIRLTETGMYCWILMMAEFFNAVNVFRDQMRQKIRAELEDYGRDVAAPEARATV
jgi:coproporphyrinogen III oxidase-like Fe-S oxidoreductase